MSDSKCEPLRASPADRTSQFTVVRVSGLLINPPTEEKFGIAEAIEHHLAQER